MLRRSSLLKAALSSAVSLSFAACLSAQSPIITSITPQVWSTNTLGASRQAGSAPIVIIGRHLTGATVTVGGARKGAPVLNYVRVVNHFGDTIDIPRSDTILSIDVNAAYVWGSVNQKSNDIESDGGARIELTTPAGVTRAVRLLYQQPVIDSMRPLRAAPGTSVVIKAKGFSYLHAPAVTITAFVNAPDGSEVPMAITKRVADTLTVTVPMGFDKSVVHMRARLASGLVLEAASGDTFAVTGNMPIVTSFTPSVWSTGALGSSSGPAALGTVVLAGRNLSGAAITVGGPRKGVTIRSHVPIITQLGDTVSVPRSDTLLAIEISPSMVWPLTSAQWKNQDIEADGGARIEVVTPAGTTRAVRTLYQQPVISSLQPKTATVGASVIIKGSGFAYLQPAAAPLTAFVIAPDGSEVPMTIAKRVADTLTVTVPYGFDRSVVHVRARLANGTALEAASRDTLSISGNVPIITSITPQTVPAFPAQAGMLYPGKRAVTIVGRNLMGASVTVGGPRVHVTILNIVAAISRMADTTYIARNDTVLAINVDPRVVWPVRGFGKSPDIDDDGGAHIVLTTPAGTTQAVGRLYQQLIVDSIRPVIAPVGASVVIIGSGFNRLRTPVAPLQAFVTAPDGTEIPMTITGRALDTVVVTVPFGFDQSQVHMRAKLANGLVLQTVSSDTLVVGVTPPAPTGLIAIGLGKKPPALPPPALTSDSTPPAASGRAKTPLAGPTRTASPDSVKSPPNNCQGGCFEAAVSGDRNTTVNGHASVEVDVVDSETGRGDFNVVLRSREDEGHYLAFTRGNLGGRPRAPGAYALANSCDEEGAENNKPDQFAAEYWVNAYREGPSVRYGSKAGTLTIDEITKGRIIGHFNFTACHYKEDGTREETRLRGKFNALWPH